MSKKAILILCIIFFLAAILRFYKLGQDPPGLYVDEASIGYNAKLILQKGVDEYGVSHPLFFKAFGEYKMPLYIYAVALSLKTFGINDFAVRFPSALSGFLTVIVFFF